MHSASVLSLSVRNSLKRSAAISLLYALPGFAFTFSLTAIAPVQAEMSSVTSRTLYSHTFDGPAEPIHNIAVDSGILAGGTVPSNVWFAPSVSDGDDNNNRWMQDGYLQNGAFTSMLLPFQPKDGFVYVLKANLTRPDTVGWVNVGFYNTVTNDCSALTTGLGWIRLKPEVGGVDVIADYNPDGGTGNIGSSSALANASATLSLTLDTRYGTGKWTLSYSLDGVEFAFTNIDSSAEDSFFGVGIGMYGTYPSDGIHANSLHLIRTAPKLVFAYGTGFTSYRSAVLADDEIDHYDRMLGWHPDLSSDEMYDREILALQDAGVDVLIQERDYSSGCAAAINRIQNLIDSADRNETDLMVTLGLMDDAYLTVSPTEAAYYFKEFKDTFFDDSRVLKHEERMVVFLWNPFDDSIGVPAANDVGPDNLQAIWDAMDSIPGVSRDDFYVVIDSGYLRGYAGDIYSAWDQSYIHDVMETCDNLYYWPCFTEDDDKDRYDLLMEAKAVEAPDEMNIAGLQPGYFRRNVGGTKVSYGTHYFRTMWENRVDPATSDYPADWVIWATWDDFSENHVLAPSRFNGGLYSALYRAMTDGWKGVAPTNSSELWMTTPSVIMKGEKVYAELIELNGCDTNRTLELEFRDFQHSKAEKATSGVFSGPTASYYNGMVNIYSMEFTTHSGFENVLALYPRVVIDSTSACLGPPMRVMDHHSIQPLYQSYRTDSWASGLGKIENYSYSDTSGARVVTFDLVDTTTVPIQSAEVRAINHRTVWSAENPTNVDQTIVFDTRDYNDAAGMVYGVFRDQNGHVQYTFPEVVNDTSTAVAVQSFDVSAEGRWVPANTYSIPEKLSEIGCWFFDSSAPQRFDYIGRLITNTNNEDVLFDYNDDGEFAEVANQSFWGYRLFLGFGPNERHYLDNPAYHPVYTNGIGYVFDGTNDIMRFKKDYLPAGSLSFRIVFTPDTVKDCYLLYSSTTQCNLKLRADGRVEFTRGVLSVPGQSITLTGSDPCITANQECTLFCTDDGDCLRMWVGTNSTPDVLDYGTEREFVQYRSFYTELFLIGGTQNTTGQDHFDGSVKELQIWSADL